MTYDPLTGEFRRDGRVVTPSKAGVLRVNGVRVQAPRLAWTLHYRRLPGVQDYILPIDGNRRNVKLSNLRLVSRSTFHRQLHQ